MPLATAPILLTGTSLTIAVPGVGAGAAIEYRCQLTKAQLTPADSSSAAATLTTFCNEYTSAGGLAVWTLDLDGYQAFEDDTDLSMVLFDHEGEEATYLLIPKGGVVSATNPGFQGAITLKPVPIGGTAKQYAVHTVSLPCKEKPVKIKTPEELAAARAEFGKSKAASSAA